MVLSSDLKYAVTNFHTPTFKLWDFNTGTSIKNFTTNFDVTTVDISYDGKIALSGEYTGIIKTWDIESGKMLKEFIGHEDLIHRAIFSNDYKRIVSCSNDNTVRVWNTETGEEIMCLRDHEAIVISLALGF